MLRYCFALTKCQFESKFICDCVRIVARQKRTLADLADPIGLACPNKRELFLAWPGKFGEEMAGPRGEPGEDKEAKRGRRVVRPSGGLTEAHCLK